MVGQLKALSGWGRTIPNLVEIVCSVHGTGTGSAVRVAAGSCGQLEEARGLFRAVSLIVSPAQPDYHTSSSPAPPPTPLLLMLDVHNLPWLLKLFVMIWYGYYIMI